MNVEFWNSVFQWGSVALVALTFFLGAGALWTGNRINARQTERLLALEIELSKQRERTATAEFQLEQIRKRQEARSLDVPKFVAEIKGKATGVATVLYQPEDPEAMSLAWQIGSALTLSGWTVGQVEPIQASAVGGDWGKTSQSTILKFPSVTRVGGGSGVTIVAAILEDTWEKKNTPFIALNNAMEACGIGVGGSLDTKLPANVFRIIVGPKP